MELDITGARILWETPINVPVLGQLKISETMVISWLVMLLITGACIWLTRDLKEENISKRQALAELIVEKANQFVVGNMGERFRYFVPFVAALFATSVLSNLISLIGLRSPTADLSTEAAWAVVVFIMITAQKIKTNGFGGYLKGFTTPIAVMTPFNILSELATPVSMACRHFGNILSGVVINALIYGGNCVRGVLLVGIVFDDNSAVHGRTVRRICKICVVRMYRMGIICRDHKASCHSRKVFLLCSSQSSV